MLQFRGKLRAGDWVMVKNPRQIAETLDQNGTRDALPFMPEMKALCGRRFRVKRRAEKTCLELPGRYFGMRSFKNDDVVILDMARCDGAEHGGCQRSCQFFWKEAWLTRCAPDAVENPQPSAVGDPLSAVMKTTSAPGRYFCQSTQLNDATEALTRPGVILKCFADVLSGSRSAWEMTRMVSFTLWHYATAKFRRRFRVGTNKRTPLLETNLRPGELVRIKNEDEIVKTLDSKGRNRGLGCDYVMRDYCGGTYPVRSRLDRMISEVTGEMLEVKGTVMLQGLECHCSHFHLGGCPREDIMYWREIWLERCHSQEQMEEKHEHGYAGSLDRVGCSVPVGAGDQGGRAES